MLPIDKFIIALEKRTTNRIDKFNEFSDILHQRLYYLISFALFMTLITLSFVKKKNYSTSEKTNQSYHFL